MNGPGYGGVIVALAAVLALLALALMLLKRVRSFSTRGNSRVPLRLVKKVALGPKQGVGLLRVGDRVLVISLGDGGARLLAEMEGADLAEILEETEPAPGQQRKPTWARMKRVLPFLALLVVLLAAPSLSGIAYAAPLPSAPGGVVPSGSGDNPFLSPSGPQVDISMGQGKDALHLSGAVGLVVFIGFLTLLPAVLLLMTSFTRIVVVLQFLRPAIGTQHAPPMQLVVALALLLSGVVMHPVLEKTNQIALQPYLQGKISQAQAYKLGIQPFREFMLANTSDKDLSFFMDLTGADDGVASLDEIPTLTLVSAFVTSELRTAFQMGFLIFVPFIVVDLIVASVLMSLGMFMLPPMMVSLPFKLLLFVLADGWTLVVKNLVLSFR